MLVNDVLIPDETVCGDAHARAPLVLDAAHPGDAERMHALIRSGRARSVHDTLEQQIHDLVRARARGAAPTLDSLVDARARLMDGVPPSAYGRWVFYPWSGRLVHLLPPAELAELRLDRNRHKITADEQARLSAFHVGVVGLAAGNAVALTLSLEGAFGHLKLADVETLSLTHLNRVRAGVHDLGTPKAVLAARQVYEVDPYARLSVFADGLEDETLDDFLGGSTPLHAVVDACDDLYLRLRLRERARALGVPVLAETGDRGTIDVERFDLEPERPLFHGLIGDLRAADVPRMDGDAQLGVELALLGPETVSERAGASVMELRRTVSAWPRLGSDAALAGATVAMAVRALALGRPLPSGRRHVDAQAVLEAGSGGPPPLSMAVPFRARRPLAGVDGRIPELVRFCVEHAVLAPSPGNRQPWRFRWDGERLWMQEHPDRAAYLLDTSRRATHVALGAALENVAVAAAHRGWRARAEVFPRPRDPSVVASVWFEPSGDVEADASLFPHLAERVTNRRPGARGLLSAREVTGLLDAARIRGARLDLLTGDEELAEVGRVVGAGERLRFLCQELHRELMQTVRWTPEEADRTRDGVPLAALEMSPLQEAALRFAARADVAAALRELGGGRAFGERAERAVAGASAVGLITVGGATPAGAVRGGRAVERVWLEATGMGLWLHPITALTYMFDMLASSAGTVFSGQERAELEQLKERFDALFPAAREGTRLLLFRLGRGEGPTARSRRLPLEEVLTYGRPAMAA